MAKFEKNLGIIITLIIVILIGVITNFILSKITPNPDTLNKAKIVEDVTNQVNKEQNKPSTYPDYDLLKDFTEINIAKDVKSDAQDPSNIKGWIKKTIYPTGQIGRMYILVEASVDNGKPLSVYDDIYLTFNDKGGHVLPNESLKTPPSDISVLLYSAESLPYKELKGTIQYNLDVLNLVNKNKQVGTSIFLSTARPGGFIKKFSLYYECLNKGECNISIADK